MSYTIAFNKTIIAYFYICKMYSPTNCLSLVFIASNAPFAIASNTTSGRIGKLAEGCKVVRSNPGCG